MSLQYLTETRRKLHGMAEPSGAEYNTQAFIESELKRFGYKPIRLGTGVYCDIGGGKNRLAFRADIDALPMTENTAVTGMADCAAKGAMHACGHDGHTANLLNVARLLGGKSDVPLRLIFQFGEEDEGGSAYMIKHGVLDGVNEIYALHLCPELDEGKIGYCYGGMFAGCYEFDVDICGKSAHCAMREKGADAVLASLDIAAAAYKAAKKHGLLVNLGKISGGHARNIVADYCKSEYTLRFYETSKCENITLSDAGCTTTSQNVLIDGSVVTVTGEGDYLLNGMLSDGQIIIDVDKTEKVQLVLNGVDITSKTSAAIYVKNADKVFVTLADNTENTLANDGVFEAVDDNNIDAVIFSE